MLAVKTYLAASPIHGVGVFAAEPIRKGQVVWYFDHRIDKLFDIQQLDRLSVPLQDFLLSHGYVDRRFRMFVLCGDNAKYINHSNDPNTDASRDSDYALRDIKEGEEITQDYRVFDDREQLFKEPHATQTKVHLACNNPGTDLEDCPDQDVPDEVPMPEVVQGERCEVDVAREVREAPPAEVAELDHREADSGGASEYGSGDGGSACEGSE